MMNELKTVLYLSYTGMTDPLGQSQVLAYLKEISNSGTYRFIIISFEKDEPFKRLEHTVQEMCNNAGILWHPLSYTAKPPVVSTFRDVRRMKKLAEDLVKKHSIALVHCRSYVPALIGLYLKKRYRIPFLFDMRGFWADERIDGGIWKRSNPLYRIIYAYFKRKEKAFLLYADHIVSLTQKAKDEILSWHLSKQPLPITVIPCCVDLALFNPASISANDQQDALQSLNIPAGATIISYIGSLGTWYMLDEMIDFMKVFVSAFPGSYFMVLTGEPSELVEQAAQKAGFDSSYLRIKKIPRHQMPLYISLSTGSLFFIKPAFSKKASSPVKQGELMAMGIPIICNDAIGDTAEIVRQYKAGIVVRAFSGAAYNAAAYDFSNTDFDVTQIKKGAAQYFSLERGAKLYKNVYKAIEHERA
jgi:glycosyltransferase involved in cell wall biosynthesis